MSSYILIQLQYFTPFQLYYLGISNKIISINLLNGTILNLKSICSIYELTCRYTCDFSVHFGERNPCNHHNWRLHNAYQLHDHRILHNSLLIDCYLLHSVLDLSWAHCLNCCFGFHLMKIKEKIKEKLFISISKSDTINNKSHISPAMGLPLNQTDYNILNQF